MQFTDQHYQALEKVKRGSGPELLDFFIGEKSALYLLIREESDRDRLRELCEELNVEFTHLPEEFEENDSDRCIITHTEYQMDEMLALSGAEHGVWLKEPGEWKENLNRRRGEILGYPECCLDAYEELRNPDEAIPKKIPEFTTYPFVTNRFLRLNRARYLLSHFPCSYDCEGSVEIGERRFNMLKEYEPERAERLKYHLSSFVIYIHDEAVLYAPEYTRDGNTVTHNGIESGRFNTTDEMLDWANQTDTVHVNGPNSVTIDGETIEGDHVAVTCFE